MTLTLIQKQQLEAFEAAGKRTATVAYDSATVIGTPEANAIAAGYVQYVKQTTATLVEVVYRKP